MIRKPAPVIDESDTRWHLDRRVPISLIVALCIQTGGVFWWASSANERLNSLEQKVILFAGQGDRLTRVEVNIEAIKDSLSDIKQTLRRPVSPMTQP